MMWKMDISILRNWGLILFLTQSGISGGAVAGIAVAGIVVVLALVVYLYFGIYKKGKARKASLLPSAYGDNFVGHDLGNPFQI